MDKSPTKDRTPTTADGSLIDALDLCVTAYQVYNQSLVWPLDPWFEPWSRVGSNRRNNMLAAARAFAGKPSELRGPGSTRDRWPQNDTLDPIISDYGQVRPWLPGLTFDGSAYRYFAARPSIRERVTEVAICELTQSPAGDHSSSDGGPIITRRIPNPIAKPTAVDVLYAFEGATGSIDGLPPAWGLLGVVLERDLGGGEYQVEIVYRGSQSGLAFRAAYQGFVLEAGNPDWVTDMEILKLVSDPYFSQRGEVVRGFRDSVATSLPSVCACLSDIARRRGGSPNRIRVSGHSLGGALAIQFAAAVTVGRFRSNLPAEIASWPWPDLDLVTFGAPKAGDDTFAENLTDEISATRIWITSDPITQFPLNAHVGDELELHSDKTGTAAHEPASIRDALVVHQWGTGQSSVDIAPWRQFETLADALIAGERDGYQIADLFASTFDEAVEGLVHLAQSVVATRSSYKLPFLKAKLELKRRSRQVTRVFEQKADNIGELGSELKRFRGIQPGSSVEDHLRRVFIIRESIRNSWQASELLSDRTIARALGTSPWVAGVAGVDGSAPSIALGPSPDSTDVAKIRSLIWMRHKHNETVNQGSVKRFRHRYVPVSGIPNLISACTKHAKVRWAPKQLMVPEALPPEAHLPKSYVLRYYGLGKLGWKLYDKWPVRRDVPWSPSYEWNSALRHPSDGWEHPSSDETFARLRLQGPNPWLLKKARDGVFELDFTQIFEGVLPSIVARFELKGGQLEPVLISIGGIEHRPADKTWDNAKRVVNAADARYVPFVLHLLNVHFIVGQSFALAAYSLPTWHPLRPFMQFFTYGTLQVNNFAYQALVVPSSYFIASGFLSVEDARQTFANCIGLFDIESWVPTKDIDARGIDEIEGHPYVADARRIWPAFEAVVSTHLDHLGLDDEAIAADYDLQAWYFTLAKVLPNVDPQNVPLDRSHLADLCSALLWNNVVHEVCGDMSPILGSQDPEDKAIINLADLREAIGDGSLTRPFPTPMMGDVFLMDQASYVSRFNVGGNKLLDINAARWVDDPRLRDAIGDLQSTLRGVQHDLEEANRDRKVKFARMYPENWEASVSF